MDALVATSFHDRADGLICHLHPVRWLTRSSRSWRYSAAGCLTPRKVTYQWMHTVRSSARVERAGVFPGICLRGTLDVLPVPLMGTSSSSSSYSSSSSSSLSEPRRSPSSESSPIFTPPRPRATSSSVSLGCSDAFFLVFVLSADRNLLRSIYGLVWSMREQQSS